MKAWIQAPVMFVKQFVVLITSELWNPDAIKVRNQDSLLVKLIKVTAISIRGFLSDKVSLQASALTYYTVMSLIPLLAVVFAIAKGFGFYKVLAAELSVSFADNAGLWELLTQFTEATMKVQSGLMAGIGLVLLLWTVLSLLSRIETSFNSIWQVTLPRPWGRRIPDYLAVIIISPFFILVSSSMTVMINTYLNKMSQSYDALYLMWQSLRYLLNFANYFFIWVALVFLYKAMPNTKVKWSAALFGAVVAGTAFHLVQVFYIFSQVTVSKYGAIYGSFAAIPLFLLWAQTSWIIVLFGAELAFAWQNVNQYETDVYARRLSISDARMIQISVMHCLAKAVLEERGALTSTQISDQMGIPVRMVRAAMSHLLTAKFVSEVLTEDAKVNAYIPIVDVHQLRLFRCIDALEQNGLQTLPSEFSPEVERVNAYLKRLKHAMENAELNVKLIDI